MAPRKYDAGQVRDALLMYLESGGKKVWSQAAITLNMPESSLKKVMNFTWPDAGEPLIEEVQDERVLQTVKALQAGPKTLTQLANALDVGPATVERLLQGMESSGRYDIQRREHRIVLPERPAYKPNLGYIWPGGDLIRLAHVSDLHFGSIHHQGSALRHFAQSAADLGCQHCLVSGDVTHGVRMYRGIEMDLYAYGADEQIQATVEGLPRTPGFHWYLQGGNHDESHYKANGTNVVRRICELRDDCTYVGFAKSDIPLMQGQIVRLYHPRGGVPYAKSYRGQKLAEDATKDWLTEAVDEGEEAKIMMLQWGHLHYKDWFMHGPMQVFNPGCFEAQNIYLAEKALTPEIGGVVSESVITEDGWCRETVLCWYHYRPVEDDYQAVQHVDLLECGIVEPLFSLEGCPA